MEETTLTVNEGAESSTAPPAIEEMSGAEYADWRMTGALPRPKTEDPAPSPKPSEATGKPEKPEGAKPSAEAGKGAPGSEPGDKPAQGERPRRGNAETRVRELLEKQKEYALQMENLRAENARLKGETREPSPARPADDQAPQWDDNLSFDENMAARDKWVEQRVGKTIEQELARRQRVEKFEAKLNEAKKELPEWDDLIAENPEAPMPALMMEHLMVEHEMSPSVMAYLIRNVDIAGKIAALHPASQAFELGKIHASLTSKPAATEKTEQPPARRATPSAPPPPTVLNGSNTAPKDEAEAALASGDFSAYQKSRNAADMAARGMR